MSDLVAEARRLGARVHVLRAGEDLESLARAADADVLGMAGGDGSISAVAGVAVEQDVPLVIVPVGTRNHFASDAGIPVDEPVRALGAFVEAEERRVDIGRASGRPFLNNVSLGLYARLVHERERRRRREVAVARLRALGSSFLRGGWHQHFVVDGLPVRASVLLISNNEYRLDVRTLGARERLDGGELAVYAARGLRRLRWTERTACAVRVETPRRTMRAAVDGEPGRFESPLDLAVEPGALRLLLPLQAGAPRPIAGSQLEREEQGAEDGDAGDDACGDVEHVVHAQDHAARGDE